MVGLSKQTGTCAKEAAKTTSFVLKYVYGRAEVRVLPFECQTDCQFGSDILFAAN